MSAASRAHRCYGYPEASKTGWWKAVMNTELLEHDVEYELHTTEMQMGVLGDWRTCYCR